MRIWGNGGRRITRQKRGGRDSFKCLGSHVPRGARSLQTAATGPSSKETRAAYDLSVSQSVFTITEKATNTTGCPVKLFTLVFKSKLCISCKSDLQIEYLLFFVDRNRCK